MFSDRDAAQNDCPGPDPDTVLHDDVFVECLARFVCSIVERVDDEIMSRCFEAYPGTDHAAITDLDPRVPAGKSDLGIDECLISNRKTSYCFIVETLFENYRT
ncbi:hypothetical protein [Methylobacterium mesophilicum]|uniref:hypothetical protein n=1 Tax=Methylobacterium mesophilicum TaxID=39956 RepID=UPI001EE16E59|nr:hypothetical protein [Methylobacterium mesophilicum]